MKKISINENTISYLQRLYYTYIGLKDVMLSISREQNNGISYDKELISYYMKEYKIANLEYKTAYDELITIYAKDCIGKLNIETYLDFSENKLCIKEKLVCGGKDCGNK